MNSNSDSDSDTISSLSDIISDISAYINSTSKFKLINIEVEITELKEYPNVTFMKVCDQSKQVFVKAIIYKSTYMVKLIPGNKIKIKSELKFYKNELELIIKSYSLIGQGSHLTALTKLKSELALLGYFDNKKQIGQNYHTIGLVSSIHAAGLRDFIHTINTRCSSIKLYLYPATMQGSSAPGEISSAIKLANRHNIVQILVVIRGGGSKDDLECFDNPILAKAIYESKLPIVTGIGHQTDISVADLCADRNFITPTATAQSITTENLLTVAKIQNKIKSITSVFALQLDACFSYISNIETKMLKYKNTYINTINNIRHNHKIRQTEISNVIRMTVNSQYKYLLDAEFTLANTKLNLIKEYTDTMTCHTHNLELISANIKELIYNYNDNCIILAKPKITCIDTNEEIHTLKKFKLNSGYRINFIDGYFDIKVRHRI